MDVNVQTQSDPVKPPPKRPSALAYVGRALASELRRFYFRVTRENVAGFLWTMAWTIPITVFIWVYAESEQEKEVTGQPISIAVVSGDPTKIVTVDPNELAVECDLKGPQANVDRFTQSLSPSSPITIKLDTVQMPDGENRIPALDYLRDNDRFKEAGVIIEKCNPVILTVYVDRIVKISLPVHAPPNIPGLQTATFDPATVMVSGPARIVRGMTEVLADLSALSALNQTGTTTQDHVQLIRDPSVTCDPAEVKATLTVAEKNVTYTLRNVPIWTIGPTAWLNGYSISLNGSGIAPPIDVSGPPQEIDELQKSGSKSVRAVLEIGPENVNTTGPVPLKVDGLPSDVHLVGAPPEVTFTATPR